MAEDRAGNTTWSALYPMTIRNYEIVPNGPGKVKVISR